MTNLKVFLTLIVGVIAGFLLCKLTADTDYPIYKPTVNTVTIKTNAEKSELKFQKKIDSLNKQQQALSIELTTTKTQLDKAKKKNIVLQNQVYTLLDKEYSKDTVELLADCDSLKSSVVQLIENSNTKDSIYEAVLHNYESQLQNKDSTIQVQTLLYDSLKISFTESLFQQKELETQAKQLQKQFKRQKFKSKIATAAMFILSGILVNQIIQH